MKTLTEQVVEQSYNQLKQIVEEMRSMILDTMQVKKEIIVEIDEEGLYPTISYNGGNHPEYASNVFSRVESIRYDEKVKDVLIVTEDGTQYFSECSIDDVFNVADIITLWDKNE